VNVIRQMGKDGRFVAGAGASDIELSMRLQAIAARTSGLEQVSHISFLSCRSLWLIMLFAYVMNDSMPSRSSLKH
jgi:hypothetical protein